MAKKMPCSYDQCKYHRIHFELPDVPRGVQYVEVPDDWEGPAYCSVTCAIMDGAYSLKGGYNGQGSI